MKGTEKAAVQAAVIAAVLTGGLAWLFPVLASFWVLIVIWVIFTAAGYPAIVQQMAYEKLLDKDDEKDGR